MNSQSKAGAALDQYCDKHDPYDPLFPAPDADGAPCKDAGNDELYDDDR